MPFRALFFCRTEAATAARPSTVPGWGWRLRQLTDGPLGAALAALVYGSWAAWANASAGTGVAVRVALTHAALSAALTGCGTAWMRGFYRWGRSPWVGAGLAFVGGLALTYTLLIGVHQLIGTPHLLLTLAAGLLPTVLFCGGYAWLLGRTGLAAPSP